MAGLAITAVFGFVAFILSYGIFVPSDLKMFSLLGAIGSMAGFALGKLAAENVTNPKGRAGCIAISAVICVGAVIEYVVHIQREYADVSDIIVLALLLTTVFFSFTFLMPFAGVVIGKNQKVST